MTAPFRGAAAPARESPAATRGAPSKGIADTRATASTSGTVSNPVDNMAASSAATTSPAFAYRSFGSFSSSLRTTFSSSAGTTVPGARFAMGGGNSVRCCKKSRTGSVASKG
jgi:hypothetical protein